MSDIDAKAKVQRQLVSDISKEAVLRDVASNHEKNTFASFTRVQEIERAIRKYYASYASDVVTGDEPFEMIVRNCGREPVVADLLDQLASARTAAALRARDMKDLNGLVEECSKQRQGQAALHANICSNPAEEELISDRVDQLIAHEKAAADAQPKEKRTAADELRDLAQLSSQAGANYLASAHTRRAGRLWPAAAKFDPRLRAEELSQLATASRAIQAEGGVRSAVRFLTDHPFSLAPTPHGAPLATTHAFAGNHAGDPHRLLPHSLRDTQRAEAEALPEVGADIKSVFVTSVEMPNAYSAALSHRGGAHSGYPYLHAKEWPVYGIDPKAGYGYGPAGVPGVLGTMGYGAYGIPPAPH